MDNTSLLAALPAAHQETSADKRNQQRKAHALGQVFHNMGDLSISFGKPQIGVKAKKLPPRQTTNSMTEPAPISEEERAAQREALRLENAQRELERLHQASKERERVLLRQEAQAKAHTKLVAARKQGKTDKAKGFHRKEAATTEAVTVVVNTKTIKGIFPGHPLHGAYLGYLVSRKLKPTKKTAKKFLDDSEFLRSIHVTIESEQSDEK